MKHTLSALAVTLFASTALLSQSASAVLPAVELDKTAATTANTASQLQTRLTAAVVSVDAQGKETLAPLTAQTQLASGNVVEYHGYVINNSPDRVRKMKVTFSIPDNMELVGNVTPEVVYGSNDGQSFSYMPIKANVNGVIQNMPMSYYKALQWDVAGLGLNEVAEVKYRAKVK